MAQCPLCSERAAKRYCPAKEVRICAVCCGTKREIEIDCPFDCTYLKAAYSYEAEKLVPDPELVSRVQRFDDEFLYRYSPVLDTISRSIVEERANSDWLMDLDVIEVFKSLSATMKTLSSGIYYESLPEGPVRLSLFRRLKELLDHLMEPTAEADRSALKVSEAVDILDFLTVAAQMKSSVRPKSRRYLNWLSGMAAQVPPAEESSGLVIP